MTAAGGAPPDAPQLPPRYEVARRLGKGGGGEVWAARDRISGREIAIKVLAENAHEREVMALVREAVSLSGVEGLGVPRVLRFGRLSGSERPYLVRELVDGESLADRIEADEDRARLVAALAQATDQLARLHRALLLHGDIKPANIIVSDAGEATFVDLGLAAPWREGGAEPQGLTPRYAAPELFAGAPLTVRAEVFALGATLAEVIEGGRGMTEATRTALAAVSTRATRPDPNERYPSADEFRSALARAAGLRDVRDDGPPAWPVIGLDAAATKLLGAIGVLRPGGGIVVTGPPSSGRTTLLRRVAWSLGVEGRAVAWVAARDASRAGEEIELELAPHDPATVVALIDDADQLGDEDLARLDRARAAGGRLVLAIGVETTAPSLPGPTFEVFPMPPLDAHQAGELVRRTVPSLGDAVVAHVVARACGWPGRVRAIVSRLERAPVAEPADVDRLLEDDAGPMTNRADIHRLLDRGHFEEAADVLARYDDDTSVIIAVARARLLTNRGDPARAIAELERVRAAALAEGGTVAAAWSVHGARAHLRAGDYAEVERLTEELLLRFELPVDESTSSPNSPGSPTVLAGADAAASEPFRRLPAAVRPLVAEALAVRGLAQSYASRHGRARVTLDQATSLARATGEPRILSVALASLAFALQRDDHLTEAKTVYEAALQSAEQAGDAGSLATLRLNLAGIAQTQGNLASAIRHLEAAVDMGKRSGRAATLRQALLNLANLELYLGRVARARATLDELAAQRDELPPHQQAQLLALEGESAWRDGDAAQAAKLCGESARVYDGMGRAIDAAEARLEAILYSAALRDARTDALRADVDAVGAALGETTAHRALLAVARGKVAALEGDEQAARAAFDDALAHARTAGQKDWVWRALDARADLELEAGQALAARRDREAAAAVLEDIAKRLPRDLREVYWSVPRRHAIRAACLLELASGATVHAASVAGATPDPSVGADRLARVLEINRAIAGEHDLERLLEKVTDHAIALLRAERGFVILRSGYGRNRDVAEVTSSHGSPTAAPSTSANASRSSHLSVHAMRAEEGVDPHVRFSNSIAERVIRSGEPVVTTSARDDARMADYVSVHQLMLQSIACVPIRARSSHVIGALYLETRLRPASSFADEMPTLVALADQVAIAIDTAQLVGENQRRARELERANAELSVAREKLEELLGHRTAQLAATRRDLRNTRAVLRGHFGYEGLVGTSEAMRRVYALIDRVKDTDVPLLITGESGTGKEMVARALHNAGPRAKKAFVGINCGAIPENLLESELFGHVRGAFTGAERDRKGLFREATEGSILLDEIGEMPAKMQAGLLRVLQEKLVRPVGGAREEPVDTRVIAATHRDLASMVEDKTFREDLYYRLNVIQVRVPPLRERLDDIPILIDHFLGIFAARYSRDRRSLSRAALKRLVAYGWPGNVRQLENVLLNAWVLSEKDELEPDDFELPDARAPRFADAPSLAARGRTDAAPSAPSGVETSLDVHKAGERERILAALASCNWNRVKAASVVGLPRRTFYRRLKEYGIQ